MSMPPSVSVADLKGQLKTLGMSQAGDKGTLEFRIRMGLKSTQQKLTVRVAGEEFLAHTLKLAQVKKLAAQAGISPIGTLDEILSQYIDHLESNKTKTSSSNTKHSKDAHNSNDNGGNPTSSAAEQKAKLLSVKVVELAELDDFSGILNLAGGGSGDLTKDSPHAQMRKAYLKLSLILHPDKNRSVPDATKVFQALVNAFERLTQPDLVEELEPKGKKTSAIARSNEGCHRTRVCCPRCKQPWSESAVEGNPPYYYNFMMTGLQSFNCATCLLEFGCMSALHFCPYCGKPFEYHPSDYHRTIKCGRKECRTYTNKKKNLTFGFTMFHCSDRVMKNVKLEVKRVREQRAKVTEQKRRRAKSFANRRASSTTNGHQEAEAAFLLGLADECPRCGVALADMGDDADQNSHLRDCDDTNGKVTAHKKRVAAAQANESTKRQKQELQDDVASKAAWDLLGGASENLWMLTDGAIQNECKERGVDTKGKSQIDLIAALASSSQSAKKNNLLTDGTSPREVTVSSLPSNLHSMSLPQLRAVAASHGMVVESSHRPRDIIEMLENELAASSGSKGIDEPLMITNNGASKKSSTVTKKRAIRKKRAVAYEEDSSDSDYEE